MIALDTNVLARAIAVEIDADAATRAQRKRAQASLSSGSRLFVPVTVIEELEWVLRGAYGMSPDDIAAAVGQALVWYRQGLDFSDALHLAQSGLCSALATFDARFARTARRLGLEPRVSAPG